MIDYMKEYIKKFPQHKKAYEKQLKLLQSSKDMLIFKRTKDSMSELSQTSWELKQLKDGMADPGIVNLLKKESHKTIKDAIKQLENKKMVLILKERNVKS